MPRSRRTLWFWLRMGVLIGAFALALVFVLHRKLTGESTGNRVVLHVAHLFQEEASNQALENLGREYNRRHPHVVVKFQRVPPSMFYQWFRTQLVTDDPPDIMQYNLQQDTSLRALVSRNFLPLNDLVNRPNPYNAGSPLEGVALKETYVDDLRGRVAYFPEMGAYFGLPYRAVTLRFIYNRDLMARITGDADYAPGTWREFVALCEQVKHYAGENHVKVFPIAAAQFGVYLVSNESFTNVTQKLAMRQDYNRDFDANYPLGTTLGYLRGNWSLESPEIQAGLSLYRQIGGFMQPGFLQFSESDVLFQFLQQRALMLITGSPALSEVAPFSLGVFRIPGIPPDDPEYGRYVLGPYSEAAHATQTPFGVPRQSRHRREALDFLQFLTSYSSNQRFSRTADQVPVIKKVSASRLAAKFAPDPRGYPYGIQPRSLGRATSQMAFARNLYLLFSQDGGVKAFTDSLENGQFRETVYRDTQVFWKNFQQNLQETDVALTGRHLSGPATPESAAEISRLTLRQTFFEMDALQTADVLAENPPGGSAAPTPQSAVQ